MHMLKNHMSKRTYMSCPLVLAHLCAGICGPHSLLATPRTQGAKTLRIKEIVPNMKPLQSASRMPWTEHVDNSPQMDLKEILLLLAVTAKGFDWFAWAFGSSNHVWLQWFRTTLPDHCPCVVRPYLQRYFFWDPVVLAFVFWIRRTKTNGGEMFVQKPCWTRFTSQCEFDSPRRCEESWRFNQLSLTNTATHFSAKRSCGQLFYKIHMSPSTPAQGSPTGKQDSKST